MFCESAKTLKTRVQRCYVIPKWLKWKIKNTKYSISQLRQPATIGKLTKARN